MIDTILKETEYTEGYGFIAHKEFLFLGKQTSAEVLILCDEDEEISQFQRDSFAALLHDWDELQHKIASAILKYYNEEEKGSYGPEDKDAFRLWWPDIDNVEQLMQRIHLVSIVIHPEYIMESKGINPVYLLFDCEWGGEDIDDNGVAVLIEDGEVTETGYKDIAF